MLDKPAIFAIHSEILNIYKKNNYGDICQFIRDTCLFTLRDMGYLVPPYTIFKPHNLHVNSLDHGMEQSLIRVHTVWNRLKKYKADNLSCNRQLRH